MSDYTPSEEFVRIAYINERRKFKVEDYAFHREEFDRWLDSVKTEERNRLIELLSMHTHKTREDYDNHVEVCSLCQNFYGIGVAIKLIQGENND